MRIKAVFDDGTAIVWEGLDEEVVRTMATELALGTSFELITLEDGQS